jgi:hypothetical protein
MGSIKAKELNIQLAAADIVKQLQKAYKVLFQNLFLFWKLLKH